MVLQNRFIPLTSYENEPTPDCLCTRRLLPSQHTEFRVAAKTLGGVYRTYFTSSGNVSAADVRVDG